MDADKLFADAQAIAATGEQVADIGALAAKMIALQEEIEAIQATLAERTVELRRLEEQDLPEAMDAANCSSFKTSDGRELKLKEDVRASISKPNEPAAHAWLREHGHGELIKRKIELMLDRGQDNVASAIIKTIQDQFGLTPEDKASVHAQTLGAFCREQLAAGVELPAGLLGLYTRRYVALGKKPK